MVSTMSPSFIKIIMDKHKIYPKKGLGQNFLVDKNILTKIIDACFIGPEDYLIEIGPGLGTLTRELAKSSRGVLAIDVDASLKPILDDVAKDYENIKFIFQDILKVNLEDEIKKAFGLAIPYKVCANIPYNITSPIIFQLLEECPNMQFATLMIQKEVAQRLIARPGTKDYGRLTITAAYYAEIVPLIEVSRNCFYPRPEVDSTVIKIIPRKQQLTLKNLDLFKDLLRYTFQKRRKTILNIFSSFFGLDKEEINSRLKQMGIMSHLRPENLEVEDYVKVVNALSPQEADE